MASRGKGARKKGHDFERDMANFLSENTDFVWKRGLTQTRDGGTEDADVVTENETLNKTYHIEVKRQKRVSIPAAYKQAITDAPSKAPIIITKSDREDILVTMKLTDWIKLFNAMAKNL